MVHSRDSLVGEFHRERLEDQESRESSIFKPPEYRLFYSFDKTLQWDPPADSSELAEALSYHFPMEKSLKSKMQAATKLFFQNRKRSQKNIGEVAQPSVLRGVAIDRDLSTEKTREDEASANQSMDLALKVPFRETIFAKDLPTGSRSLSDPSPKDDTSKQLSQDSIIHNQEAVALVQPSSGQIITWSCNPGAKQRGRKRRYEKDEAVKVAANRGMACEVHRRKKMKCDPNLCSRNKQNLPNAGILGLEPEIQEMLLLGEVSQGIAHRSFLTNTPTELIKPKEHANHARQIRTPSVVSDGPSPSFSPELSETLSNLRRQEDINLSEIDPVLASSNISSWNWSVGDGELTHSDNLFSPNMVSLSNPVIVEQSISFNPNELSRSLSSVSMRYRSENHGYVIPDLWNPEPRTIPDPYQFQHQSFIGAATASTLGTTFTYQYPPNTQFSIMTSILGLPKEGSPWSPQPDLIFFKPGDLEFSSSDKPAAYKASDMPRYGVTALASSLVQEESSRRQQIKARSRKTLSKGKEVSLQEDKTDANRGMQYVFGNSNKTLKTRSGVRNGHLDPKIIANAKTVRMRGVGRHCWLLKTSCGKDEAYHKCGKNSTLGTLHVRSRKVTGLDWSFPRIFEHHNRDFAAAEVGNETPERKFNKKMLVGSLTEDTDESSNDKLTPNHGDEALVKKVSEMAEAVKSKIHATGNIPQKAVPENRISCLQNVSTSEVNTILQPKVSKNAKRKAQI